jgi:hypothetical protein
MPSTGRIRHQYAKKKKKISFFCSFFGIVQILRSTKLRAAKDTMCLHCQSKAAGQKTSPLWTLGMMALMMARRVVDQGSLAGVVALDQELVADRNFGIAMVMSTGVIIAQCIVAIVYSDADNALGATAVCQQRLSEAAQRGDIMAVSRALKDGADPNVIGKGPITPLQQAFLSGNPAMTSLLLNNGAQFEHLTQCAPCASA